jgi:hypothetical protein
MTGYAGLITNTNEKQISLARKLNSYKTGVSLASRKITKLKVQK